MVKCKKAALWILGNLSEYWDTLVIILLVICLILGACWYFHRRMEPEEAAIRLEIVETARMYLGSNEQDGSHRKIVDLYNTHEPQPRAYQVTYEDNWCASFVSAIAIQTGMTDWIPVECSCEQQIRLFDKAGDWQEDECCLPRPGDFIFYAWGEWRKGDCTAWANHVGIVVETFGPVIKVIEGNKDDRVAYRYIFLNDIEIRGYGLPDYRKYAACNHNH